MTVGNARERRERATGRDHSILARAGGPADFDKLIREAERRSPSHETPTVEDVGAMVAFLVSDDARHITGNVTFIDSGYHIMG